MSALCLTLGYLFLSKAFWFGYVHSVQGKKQVPKEVELLTPKSHMQG